jgi:hypothetical protein
MATNIGFRDGAEGLVANNAAGERAKRASKIETTPYFRVSDPEDRIATTSAFHFLRPAYRSHSCRGMLPDVTKNAVESVDN